MSIKDILVMVLIIAIAVAISAIFVNVPKPTGHEQAGPPDKKYEGLAQVYNGKPKMDISTKDIQINIEGVNLTGFLAQPVNKSKYPGVVMIHEWWGLNDQIKSMATVLAGEGYVVLAVDLFDGKVATTVPDAQENLKEFPNDKTLPKLKTAVKYLRSLSNVDNLRIASLGWCYGGGQSFQLATNEKLQGAVIYYGQVSTDKSILANLKSPVIGFYGEEDTSLPVKDILEFEKDLKDQGTNTNITIYKGAGHAFANPTNTQAFRKERAIDAWTKTLEFLKQNLKS